MQQDNANRTSQGNLASSVNAGLGGVRFPGEDGGRSLGDMAQRDLDAALQLLADRAQYITGSSGVAIALRRGGMNDMMCRASSGSNAPELGALLSTEFGLSGESVRTRQLLRCDDAERDARVNRDVCRELGIASVAVMPVVNDDEVLGVFELFSGKPHAFGDRDFAALRRLSEMVETAVRLARAAEGLPEKLRAKAAAAKVSSKPVAEQVPVIEKRPTVSSAVSLKIPESPSPNGDSIPAHPTGGAVQAAIPATSPKIDPPELAAIEKPCSGQSLMWSVAPEGSPESLNGEADQSHLPAAFRNLRKCEACGFPISAGRLLCVECEEKRWRGQLRSAGKAVQPDISGPPDGPVDSAQGSRRRLAAQIPPEIRPLASGAAAAPAMAKKQETHTFSKPPGPAPGSSAAVSQPVAQSDKIPEPGRAVTSMQVVETIREMLPEVTIDPTPESADSSPELVLSAGLEPSQSWVARNQFVLIAMAVIVGGAVAFLLLH